MTKLIVTTALKGKVLEAPLIMLIKNIITTLEAYKHSLYKCLKGYTNAPKNIQHWKLCPVFKNNKKKKKHNGIVLRMGVNNKQTNKLKRTLYRYLSEADI